jgi:hypothetical protein
LDILGEIFQIVVSDRDQYQQMEKDAKVDLQARHDSIDTDRKNEIPLECP